MGKVSFPLINIRKDVTGYWHQIHYTGDTAEIVTVPTEENKDGYHTVFLKEVPDSGSRTDYLSTTTPKISGLTEYRGNPVDSKTRRLLMTPTQFYVNYQTGEILFHPYQAGNSFSVDYWGRGSLIEADDINFLENRISKLEKEHDLPEFISFSIIGFENGILEVGESLPRKDEPILIEFTWEMLNSGRVKENTIQITNLLTNQVIGENLPNTGKYSVEFQETFNFPSPHELVFKISAERINGEIIEKEFKIKWVDRIYWGIGSSKDISADQVEAMNNTKLLNSDTEKYAESIKFIDALQQYKVIAIPKRYSVKKFIDSETSLNFVFDLPIMVTVLNDHNLEIPYLVYCSSYPITSEVEINFEMEREING